MAKLNTTEHTFVEVIEIKKEEESAVDLNDPLNFNNDFRIKEEKEVDEFNEIYNEEPRTSNNSEVHKCSTCNISFPNTKLLSGHYRTPEHKGNKQFQCIICNTIFNRRGNLEFHVSSVHEGKKPFHCTICDSSFRRNTHLTRHIASVHEKAKPFSCDICHMSFARKQNLVAHSRNIHQNYDENFEDVSSENQNMDENYDYENNEYSEGNVGYENEYGEYIEIEDSEIKHDLKVESNGDFK